MSTEEQQMVLELQLPLDPDSERYNLGLPGQCYMAALAVARDLHNSGLEQVQVCHGVASIQSTRGGRQIGERILHAWVELEIAVDTEGTQKLCLAFDASNASTPVFASTVEHYYWLGKVNPTSIRRYSMEEASAHCSRLGHFGPFAKPLEPVVDWSAEDEAMIDSDGCYADDHEYTPEENELFSELFGWILGDG